MKKMVFKGVIASSSERAMRQKTTMKHKQMPADGRQDHVLPSRSGSGSSPAQPAAAILFMSSMVKAGVVLPAHRPRKLSMVPLGPRTLPGDREDAVADLICDLLHYSNVQGFNCDDIVRRSVALFKEEVEDELNGL